MATVPKALRRWTTAAVLFALGGAAVAIAVLSALGSTWPDLSEMELLSLLCGIVGALAIAVALDRVLAIEKWSRQLDRMEASIDKTGKDLLERASWSWFLPGDKLAYQVAVGVCEEATDHIRALTLGQTPRVKNDLADAIVKRLQSKQDKNLKFTSIYSVDFSKLPAGFEADARWRHNLHQAAGVSKQSKLLFINQRPQIGFGILLVDDKHTVIGVVDPDTNQYRGVLLFRNQEEVTKHFVTWFEHSVKANAVDFLEWLPAEADQGKAVEPVTTSETRLSEPKVHDDETN